MNRLNNDILNYRVFGDGHPVVFLHGFLESSSMWEYIDLSGCKAVLIDLPGHGKSPIDENETIASMASKVRAIMSQLQLVEYSIIGHSMGGYVGLEILSQEDIPHELLLMHSNFWEDSAQKKSDRLRVSTIVHQKKEAFLYEAIPNLFIEPNQFDTQIRHLLNEALLMSPAAISTCSLAMKDRVNHTELVSKYSGVITVVQGIEDSIVTVTDMRNALKGIEVDYYEIESGHMSHIERNEPVQKIISRWIKKTETN